MSNPPSSRPTSATRLSLSHITAQNETNLLGTVLGVRITADRWDSVSPQVHVATAYLVFVAVDAEGKPREVPQVVPVTDEDRRRMREAEIRRSHRLARRAAIIASREGPQ
jgi:acyl-CoA hydrolase